MGFFLAPFFLFWYYLETKVGVTPGNKTTRRRNKKY